MAGTELLAGLDRVAVRCGRLDLATIWPVVAAWWRTPVDDVAAENDRHECLLSRAPAAHDPHANVFAGTPPEEVTGQDLMCLEFGRQFVRRTSPIATVGLDGGAGLSLWYANNQDWDVLRQSPGWIEMGDSTPNVDALGDGSDPERLIAWLEASALFEVALSQPTLALVFVDDGPDDLVIAASDDP
jgi:hypothetical protein